MPTDDRAKFEALTGDEARSIARSVATSASDSPSPVEYVLAGWNAALASAQAASAEPAGQDANAEIKALYVQHFGSDRGWLDHDGSFFIEGVRVGRTTPAPAVAPAAVTDEPEAIRMAYKTGYEEGYEDGSGGAADHDACEEGWQQYLAAIATRTPEPQAERKNCDEFNKLLTEGLDDEYRIVDWTDCACGRIHCKHANGEWMTVRQSTPEEDEAVNRSLGLLADLDKSIADITAPEKPGEFSQDELASAEAALSERSEWEADRAAINLHAASGDEDDLREACDMIQKVRKAETNGEALFAVVSYRKAIREKLLAEPQPDSRGQAREG